MLLEPVRLTGGGNIYVGKLNAAPILSLPGKKKILKNATKVLPDSSICDLKEVCLQKIGRE